MSAVPRELTADEAQQCERIGTALDAAADEHAREARRLAGEFKALFDGHEVVRAALAKLIALHATEIARCRALDCSPPDLGTALDWHGLVPRATAYALARELNVES